MQTIKIFIALTLFLASVYAQNTCSAPNTALLSTLYADLTADGEVEITIPGITDKTVISGSGVGTDVSSAQSFNQGACRYDYVANDVQTQSGIWLRYYHATQDLVFSLELTNADHSTNYVPRVLMFSTDVAACGSGTSTWQCEGRVTDMCQGYPEQPLPYQFKAGRYYHIFVHTDVQQSTYTTNGVAAAGTMKITFIKKDVVYPDSYNMEAAPSGFVVSGTVLPNWSATTKSSGYGWQVGTAQEGSKQANISRISGSGSVGIGTKMLFVNPFINGNTVYTDCSTAGSVCDHTDDNITTPIINLSAFTNAQLTFANYFTSGQTSVSPGVKLIGQIFVSVANGPFTLLHDMVPIVNSDSDPTFNTEKVSLADVAGNANVRFRFRFSLLQQNVLSFGWIIDNIMIVDVTDYDMCTDGFSCTTHTCSSDQAEKGCEAETDDSVCNDENPFTCMTNECAPEAIGADATTGCTSAYDDLQCDDSITCTEDKCLGADGADSLTGCTHKEMNNLCNDNLMCSIDYCTNSSNPRYINGDANPTTGCYHVDGCDDSIACTTDTCESVPGYDDKCLHTIDFQKCDDKIDCTYELTCDPEQPGYDAVTGCIRIPMHDWCDDNDPCTIDSCDPTLDLPNSCVNTNVTCDDCLACTVDYCINGACEHDPIHEACDDHFDCTVDICDESLGKCTNNANDTYCEYFGDPCMVHYCRPHASADDTGCVSFPKVCDDEIACTEDLCNSTTGECVFIANDTRCDDDLPCTDDVCDASIGKCTNKPNSIHCNDGDACTIDYCSMSGKCEAFEKDCSDTMACSDDYCEDGECKHNYNNTNCDDGFDCTEDVCDESLGRCTNLPSNQHCTERGNPCYIHFCQPETSPDTTGCYSVAKDCSDAISCTYDFCDEVEGCQHIANDSYCDDGHACTDDVCDIALGKCTNFPNDLECNDRSICTIDTCGCDGECHYEPLDCNDQIYCTVDACDDAVIGGCTHTPNDTLCDDGNDCTDDFCSEELGRCVNTPRDDWCLGRSSCETGTCSLEAKGCVYESHDDWCEDLVGCTLDVCDGANGCVHNARNSLCDDGIGCTMDVCNYTGCHYLPQNNWCNDAITCTEDICSTTDDCQYTAIPNFCNDDINCTKDYCSFTDDCVFEPVHSWCSDGVPCTDDKCMPDDINGDYCHNTAIDANCEDGFTCSENICDLDLNCVANYTACPWYERTLDDKICIECMSSHGQIEQTRYEDGTGAMGFKVLNADSGLLKDNLVLTPDNSVIIGGDQNEIPIYKGSGLVVGNNMRIVPQDAANLPVCNEIRRGTFIVTQKSVACGSDMCLEDVVQICVKDQTYHYVTLSTKNANL